MDLTYHVPDMTCAHCERAITAGVKAAVPQASVAIDLNTHRVAVSGAPDALEVSEAIRKAGYTPELV